MVPHHGRGAEPGLHGNQVESVVGFFQQLLSEQQALPVEPCGRGRTQLRAEPAGEGARGHQRSPGELVDGEVLVQAPQHPGRDVGEGIGRQHRHRRLDELGLPAVTLRRHHHPPGDHVRRGRTELAAHHVQGRVDPGRGSCAGHHVGVIDEQHIGVYLGARVRGGEGVGVHPVCGAAAAVEDASGAQDEGAAADAQYPGATRFGLPHHPQHVGVDRTARLVGRDRHQVGIRRRGQIVVHHDVEAELGALWPRFGRHHVEVEDRSAVLRAIDAEHLADHPELERGHAGKRNADDFGEHGGSSRRDGRNMRLIGNPATRGRK